MERGEVGGEEVFSWSSDDKMDGYMMYDQLRERLSGVMTLPETFSLRR